MWVLVVLALVAVLFVGVMVFVVGTSGGGQRHPALAEATGRSTAVSSNLPSTSQHSSKPPSAPASGPPTPVTGNPCPTPAACVVDGDIGQMVKAVNDFRAAHGVAPVAGAVTAAAQACAVQQGDGPSCAPHYFWEPVPAQDGIQVMAKIAAGANGTAWLLDPGMAGLSVGWAYVPGPTGGAGLFECAVLKAN
jgi:hypothetical protein